VWIFYEIPHRGSAVFHASFYPCTVDGPCHGPETWGVRWFTAMFMHGSWDHILGNMRLLVILGKNVEDSLGHVPYLALYIIGGFVAAMTQALMTLRGAYFVLYPDSRNLTYVLVFPVWNPAWMFLGLWFLYQLVEAKFGFFSPSANRGGRHSSRTLAASCSGSW
jgi:membrane associated rhomboid family serine protease